VDELADSGGLIDDPDGLRRRLAAGAWPPTGTCFSADCCRSARSGRPVKRCWRSCGPAVAFRAAIFGPAFNQIPYLPALRQVVRRVLGPGAFSYPAKVLRAVYPERPEARPRGRYVHYDYGVSGVQDMLTSWVPLMDIPPRIGGLAVRPGGHLGPPRRPRPLSRSEPGWATTSYEPGDVLIFHCLAPHAALPNQGSALRISGDFRWQRPDQPAPAELIAGPNLAAASGRSHEMFGRMFGRAPWWEPVPAGLDLYPRAELVRLPPGPSRLIRVDPGWQRWRPPPAVVH